VAAGVVIFTYPVFWVCKNQMFFLNTQIYGELKANAFFALLVKTEKNRFYH
jgi:hypothetical protein